MWLKHVYMVMSEHSRSDREGLPPVGDESETVHEVLFREIADAVFLLDVESTEGDYRFRFRWNNASHRQRTGFSTDDLRGKTPRELLGDDRGATIADNYRRCVSAGETIQYEETLELPDGTSHWQTKLTPVTEDGTVTRIIGVARDITDQKERERERRAMARRFETVLETMSTAVFLKSTDGEYYLMSRACRELLGIDDEDITGLTDEDIFPPDVVEQVRTDDRTVAETDEMIEIEETVPTKSGDSIRLTRKSPVYDESGEITAICGVSTDITEQKEREQEIERLKERLNLAVDGANLGVWDWEMTTDRVEFNDQWAEMLDYSPEEIDPHLEEWEQRVHPDDLGPVEDALERHIAGDTDYYDTEHRMRTADGSYKWIRDVGRIVAHDQDGEPTRAVGIHLDIDDRKTSERQLKQERDMFTQGPAVVFKWREVQDWPVEYVSENVEDVFGYTVEELQSGAITSADLIHDADRERVFREVKANTQEGVDSFSHEPYRVVTADGSVRWVLDYTRNIWQDSEITHRLGYLVDITEQKRREQEIEQLTERLSLALRSTNTGVWELDPATDEVIWTESMERLFGVDPGTFDGTYDEFAERVHPDDLPAVERAVDRSVSTGEPLQIEYRIQADDGKHRWVESRAELVGTNDDERRMIGVATDISDRKEYEQAIEATQEKLRQIIDLVPDLIFVKNSEGEYLLANEATAAAYGATPEEIEGNREAEVIPDADDSEEFRRDDLDVLSSGQPKTIPEEELTTADGETRVLETTKIPYQVADSGDEAVLGYARDITALKEYEETLERQRDNLEVLNQVVRHDVRNALQLVLAYGATLEPHVDEGGEEYLRQILEAGREAVDITRTAGDVTEVLLHSDGDRRPVSLRHILEAQVEEARSSHERAIVSIDGTVPDTRVLADDLLESVFRNLLNNAVVHNDTDLPSITVSATVTEERTRVRVTDNGPGIPDERKDELFERGRKGLDSDGTGIGLYLVRTLVDRYGGDVWVEDADTGGSAFVVELERHVSEDA